MLTLGYCPPKVGPFSALNDGTTPPAPAASGQKAATGTQTGFPQQESTMQIPGAQSALLIHGAKPPHPVAPSTHTPPPSAVDPQTGNEQALAGLQFVKVPHVCPVHSGSGLLGQDSGPLGPPVAHVLGPVT